MNIDFNELVKTLGPSGATVFAVWAATAYIKNQLYQMRDQIFKEIHERLNGLDDRLSRVERRSRWDD